MVPKGELTEVLVITATLSERSLTLIRRDETSPALTVFLMKILIERDSVNLANNRSDLLGVSSESLIDGPVVEDSDGVREE